MRIVRLANFVTERSGGLRTTLRELGVRYAGAGHDPVLIVPGPGHAREVSDQGLVITLPGPMIPGSGGYRVLVNRSQVTRLLEELAPDRLEVSDRTTLRWTGGWARRRGVGSVMVSHESLAGLLRLAGAGLAGAGLASAGSADVGATGPGQAGVERSAADRLADRLNARTASMYDQVVCTTSWAAAEFRRLGVANLRQVPLGVDLSGFHPERRDPAVRLRYAGPDELLLVHCSRLSPEKRPERSLNALAELLRRGVPAALVVAGAGPLQSRLRQRADAKGLPVRFEGFVADRGRLADLLAAADVVLDLMARPADARRRAARQRAQRYTWHATAAGFLRIHESISAQSTPSARR